MRFALSVLALLVLPVIPLTAAAQATTGQAYDSVIMLRGDSAVTPYDASKFETDFQAMSQSQVTPAQGAVQRHYVTPAKERTDYFPTQRATIVDCGARTITILDLAKKTYVVQAFGAAPPSASGPATLPVLDMAQLTVTGTSDTQALGRQVLGQQSVDVYQTTNQMRMESAAMMTLVQKMVTTTYYGPPVVSLTCANEVGLGPLFTGMSSRSFSFDTMAAQIDKAREHIKITKTGATPPTDRIPLYMTMRRDWHAEGPVTFSTGSTAIAEVGHIRSISSDDPIFTIPSDFQAVTSLD